MLTLGINRRTKRNVNKMNLNLIRQNVVVRAQPSSTNPGNVHRRSFREFMYNFTPRVIPHLLTRSVQVVAVASIC